MRTRLPLVLACLLAACGGEDTVESDAPETGPLAFVQLFEWSWNDIASECETVLGGAGYTAVQVSPPNEHIEGPAWWTRYQPVSYLVESRGGTRAEFADMVARCAAAGVDVYADAVINHMAGFPEGTGVAGSLFAEYDYPAVPYVYDDFHHCGSNEEDTIRNYQDLFEIQNCQLGTLDDLDTGKPAVQEKIVAYLDDLLSLGVAGFRLDASKHMHYTEVHAIVQGVDGEPFVYQEVIDRGGEPVSAADYLPGGYVTEFKYADLLRDAFENGNTDALTLFWTRPGWLPGDQAIVFVDNHDIQRGHGTSGGVINYKDGRLYDLAVAFMLAHPYGYPLVMSSYAFDDDQQGPPDVSPLAEGGCGDAWICEHRRAVQVRMLEFRAATAGTDLNNWQIIDDAVIAFDRGNLGFIAINASAETQTVRLQTSLAPGRYTGLISGDPATVEESGGLDLTLEARDFIVLMAEQ